MIKGRPHRDPGRRPVVKEPPQSQSGRVVVIHKQPVVEEPKPPVRRPMVLMKRPRI